MAEDPYLAKPCGTCCLKSAVYDGEPHGSIVTIAGVETYISLPEENKANGNILFYFPDIFAFTKNGLLLMDSFACAGYLVLSLDYFRGVSNPRKT
jgi:hypothetical protein